jgi:hypothetical protein
MLAAAFPDGELNGGKHDANYDFADRSRCYGWGSAALAQTPTAPNSGAGVPGSPGNKSGPAVKPGEHNPTVSGQDQRSKQWASFSIYGAKALQYLCAIGSGMKVTAGRESSVSIVIDPGNPHGLR